MPSRLPSVSKAFLLGAILVLFQALDGIFTSIGVSRFGLEIEGNPLMRLAMEQFGHVPVLGLVKCFAMAVVVALICFAKRLPWISNALGAINCVYLFAAIVPWTYILFVKPYLM